MRFLELTSRRSKKSEIQQALNFLFSDISEILIKLKEESHSEENNNKRKIKN